VKGANKIEVEATRTPAAPPADRPGPGCCRADEVPANGMKEFTVGGTGVLIVHTGTELVAFQAMCPHEAVPLEQGIHDGCLLTCLEHTWQFRSQDRRAGRGGRGGAEGYRLRESQGEIYVALD